MSFVNFVPRELHWTATLVLLVKSVYCISFLAFSYFVSADHRIPDIIFIESRIKGNETYKAINPIISKVGDFTPFYITIAICSVILGCIIILNIVCCCSRYSDYWLDRHTGNRWIVSIWSATPHKQPPLDFTELESQYHSVQYVHPYHSEDYHEIQRHHSEVLPSVSQQPLTSSQEFLELHKRESDI